METLSNIESMYLVLAGPHSLGKLIEWKHIFSLFDWTFFEPSPHSLGKLIEWKQDVKGRAPSTHSPSPLAGETN